MTHSAARPLLGYLNLSAGAADPKFYQAFDQLFREVLAGSQEQPAWLAVRQNLESSLTALAGQAGFETTEQAAAVLHIVFDRLLPAYREFHRDLLAHLTDEQMGHPCFLAQACRAVLRQGPPWTDEQRIVDGALAWMNDFIGHRPVAVLRSAQKLEPFAQEWVCPIPLFIAGAGVAVGRYQELVTRALDVLASTDRGIRDAAGFDPDLLAELALDPRAYDFDHPVHKRPNYHFGQWDPHTLDNAGNYRRFILQAVTLDALLERVAEGPGDKQELMHEAAVVLAGTMLMAAGVSGRGPEAHDSNTTLATLIPKIAAVRDRFYKQQLERTADAHGDRLRAEAQTMRQPFGAVRHDLNQRFARLRALQLQHVHLAQLWADMGHLDAASRQLRVVPVASARMLSEISGRITAGHMSLSAGSVAAAADQLDAAHDLLGRAIRCGAMVDPSNILGFQGQFSLFPALENSVRDHRVDVLIHLVSQILSLGVRTTAESAAAGAADSLAQAQARIGTLASWWDKFATLDVSGVESISGRESVTAAEAVAAALSAWREAGAAGGDIAFWRKHVASFTSPRAYALVIDTLLEKRDYLAALGLLVQWLSEAENMPLLDADCSFHRLAVRWLSEVLDAWSAAASEADATRLAGLITRLFDYFEANAGEYWHAPRLAFAVQQDDQPADDEDDANPFEAAYEGVTYRDTTDDGIEGATLSDGDSATDYELDLEAARLRAHGAFLHTLARLRTAASLAVGASATGLERGALAESLSAQLPHTLQIEKGLLDLLAAVQRYALARPTGEHSSLVEYDRRRRVKESILADVAAATLETVQAARWIRAATATHSVAPVAAGDRGQKSATPIESAITPVLAGLLASNTAVVRRTFPALRARLEQEPILFVPLARGGDSAQLVRTQSHKQLIVELLAVLPRLGLAAESCQMLSTAIAMERHRPEGDRVITEFDRLFEIAYRAMVESLIDAAADEPRANGAAAADVELFDSLQAVTEPLLRLWIEHSRAVRLSTLERVADPERWRALVAFVERYGHDLFTQRFLNIGSLRAILDQGAEIYLRLLADSADPRQTITLIEDLDQGITHAAAAEQLQLIVEAVVENHAEYREYNATTTQSDHGELLYTLLDFLRLKASYERVCWNIRPIIMAHEILMRRGQLGTAELWRRAAADQTGEAADAVLKQAAALSREYQMRLPSIDARLAERFVRPLAVDALRALVRPAMAEIRAAGPGEACARLEQELAEFAEQPSGSGMELPGWLAALEEEVAQAQAPGALRDTLDDLRRHVLPQQTTLTELTQQVREWGDEGEESEPAQN